MKFQTFYQNAFYLLVGSILGFCISMAIFYKPMKAEIQLQTQPIEKVITTADSVAVAQLVIEDSVTKAKKAIQVAKKVKLNDETLMAELVRQGVKHPKIVLAQAKLETGHYKSDACKKYNNLFGLRHKKGYYKFDTWQQSVTAYRDYVQYKYTGGDYFAFLNRIGYAEEPRYTQYVKSLL